MARLGRSFPVNWRVANRNSRLINTPGSASLPATISLSAVPAQAGNVELDALFIMGNSSIPPASAFMPAGVSLAAGGLVTSNAALAFGLLVAGIPDAWIYTGPVPLTYLQYLDSAGTLTAVPGMAVVAMGEASGWTYDLPVPPPDGRWVTIGAGGQVTDAGLGGEEEDDLAWNPPGHLAHLPVPFELIGRRIMAKRKSATAGTR